MADLMTFPNTVEEFMDKYKITDIEQVYTNGADLVPIFRMEQWFEHLPAADAVELEGSKVYKCLSYTTTGIPTADAVEGRKKKGKWIKMSDADGVYWACSECGEDIPRVSDFDPQFDLFPRLKSIEKTRFCPFCGAEMEEERIPLK